MNSIQRAEELLGHIGPFETLSTRRRSYYAKDILAGYIGAVKALEESRNKFHHAADYLIRHHPTDTDDTLLAHAFRQDAKDIGKALAGFEKLFADV